MIIYLGVHATLTVRWACISFTWGTIYNAGLNIKTRPWCIVSLTISANECCDIYSFYSVHVLGINQWGLVYCQSFSQRATDYRQLAGRYPRSLADAPAVMQFRRSEPLLPWIHHNFANKSEHGVYPSKMCEGHLFNGHACDIVASWWCLIFTNPWRVGLVGRGVVTPGFPELIRIDTKSIHFTSCCISWAYLCRWWDESCIHGKITSF